MRTIGIARARLKIRMMNLGYNIRRLVQLERVAAAPARVKTILRPHLVTRLQPLAQSRNRRKPVLFEVPYS